MSTPATPVGVITDAADGLQDDVLAIAGVGLGIGAVVFALKRGWSLLKGFSR